VIIQIGSPEVKEKATTSHAVIGGFDARLELRSVGIAREFEQVNR